MEFRETGVIVDRVWYSPARLRQIVAEHERLTQELALVEDTLRLRSAALDRVAAENEMLRAANRPNP